MIKKIAILCSIFLNLCIVRWEPVAIRMTWEAVGSQTFTFYTENSNVFAFFVCLLVAVCQVICLFTGRQLPRWVKTLKYIATCCPTMTFLTVVFVLGPYCADQGGVVFLLTESSMLYHHLLNPLCAFVSFVLLEREPKLPARCVPLALVPTMLYGSVALWANYQRLITGPYPFLLVYQQTTRQTVLWCAAILAMNLLYAWLVWRLGGNRRKKEKCGLAFQKLSCKKALCRFWQRAFSRVLLTAGGIPAFAQAARVASSQTLACTSPMWALPSSSMHRRLWPMPPPMV